MIIHCINNCQKCQHKKFTISQVSSKTKQSHEKSNTCTIVPPVQAEICIYELSTKQIVYNVSEQLIPASSHTITTSMIEAKLTSKTKPKFSRSRGSKSRWKGQKWKRLKKHTKTKLF